MDFGTLLHVAKKNSQEGADKSRCYSTKFAPPKKEARDKKLSANIQKFLAKKEAEEREKEREKIRKRDELLAMRDTKSKNKINKMLKVIKSANKSVIADAVDNENTAVTLHGPDQPDEDDYGYVSQEASAFYSKMMEKYKSQPEEDKFSTGKRKVSLEVSRKVQKEPRDRNNPPKRQEMPPPPDRVKEEKQEKQEKPKVKKPPPPPVDFQSLLKLAEKKQFEPIEIVQEVKKKEPERPMTQKEKQEHEERLAIIEAKKKRMLEAKNRANGKIHKVTAPVASSSKVPPTPSTSRKPEPTREPKESKAVAEKRPQKPIKKEIEKPTAVRKDSGSATKKPQERPKPPPEPQKTREFPPKDVQKTREFPPKDVHRPREIPRSRPEPQRPKLTKPPPKRLRIEDDDSEYDSEMDDFIDDGPEDDANAYSKHIREIFGYDRSRYRDEVDDDKGMESTFAQQMREEYISKKIGLMEDLEDMRQEELEKERKLKNKKRKK
ncbi:protein SPT2 homolog [Phlebotomus papatasi]|uniref:protein SPT2 homolog n=1 Tax=Phlebotomus papatasi TaxID=29031 RepID=UPI002483B6E2|nr:protein SPT2 homolog [Phlebotomus papatasi]